MNSRTESCQTLVIGSGPGGAVTASLLAAEGRDVILAEEGPALALDSCPAFGIEEMATKYRCGGVTVAMGRPKVAYAEGRVVGGGSEINSGLYHRTPEGILAAWKQSHGLQEATAADLEPHFLACETALSVGLMPTEAPLASRKLALGSSALGWKSQEVPRWYRYEGPAGSPGTGRQSMSKTFIPSGLAAGMRLLPNLRIERLERQGSRWRAQARSGPATRSVIANHVVVCGGAVQTPALLRKSGITHNVGRALALHPTVKVVALFPETLNFPGLGVPVHQVKEFAPRMSFGCSISSLPFLMLGLVDYPADRARVQARWQNAAIYYAMISGGAHGSVRGLPGSPDPLVRYGLEPDDLADLALGLSRLCQLLFAAGAVELFPGIAGLASLKGPDDLRRLPACLPPNRTSLMTIHLFSSCPMGEDRRRTACDSFGRVHDAPGLSVHDGSLLCGAPGVNPQGSIMAFARRNTLRLLQDKVGL